jgi:hypothetical protein
MKSISRTQKRYINQLLILSISIILPNQVYSGNSIVDHQVKVAYLYQILRFVHWPDNVFKHGESPFTVCVAGEDKIVGYLPSQKRRKVGRRNVEIKRPTTVEQASQCHLFYIAEEQNVWTTQQLLQLQNRPVLLVSSAKGFIDGGGMLGFVLDQSNKVRIEINTQAISRAGLELSAKLQEVSIRRIPEFSEGGTP